MAATDLAPRRHHELGNGSSYTFAIPYSIRTSRRFFPVQLRTCSPQNYINRVGQFGQGTKFSASLEPRIVQTDAEASVLPDLAEHVKIQKCVVLLV